MSMAGLKEVTLGQVHSRRQEQARELDQLMRSELPRVERLLSRMLGPRQDLEDLVQNVFLELLRAWPQFRGQSTPATFVGGITVRIARRAMRRSAFQRLRGLLPGQLVATAGDPEQAFVDHQRLHRVHVALGRLSSDKRVAFTLWALEGCEPAEIAAWTGASLSAVRSRIFYAQKQLRALAAEDALLREALEEENHGAR